MCFFFRHFEGEISFIPMEDPEVVKQTRERCFNRCSKCSNFDSSLESPSAANEKGASVMAAYSEVDSEYPSLVPRLIPHAFVVQYVFLLQATKAGIYLGTRLDYPCYRTFYETLLFKPTFTWVFRHTYTHAHTYGRGHTHTHTYTHTCTHTHAHTHTHTHTYTHTHLHTHTRTRTHTHTGVDEHQWKTLAGQFSSIMACPHMCSSRQAPKGMSPWGHLGNGCADLIMLTRCSKMNHAKWLIRQRKGNSSQVR